MAVESLHGNGRPSRRRSLWPVSQKYSDSNRAWTNSLNSRRGTFLRARNVQTWNTGRYGQRRCPGFGLVISAEGTPVVKGIRFPAT